MPRPKSYVVEYPAVFPERNFAFGAAVQVVKYGLRYSSARDRPEVLDAHNPWRSHSTMGSCHLQFQRRKP
jgi:hypothetical protein